MKKFLLSGALFLCSILSAFALLNQTDTLYFSIYNANQLSLVGKYSSMWGGKHVLFFRLMNDIDLSEWIAANNRSQGWTPIGKDHDTFDGIFDGNGYTISGLKITRDNTDNVGLFGSTYGSTIKNLIVKGDITGQNAVGGIVGKGYNVTISNCRYEGKVNGKMNVGGVVGFMENKSPLTDCSMQGEIKGTESVGGIVGGSNNLSGAYSNLKSNGTITAVGNNCGGLFGILSGNKAYMSGCTVENAIKGNNNIGGIVGSLRGNKNQFWTCTAKVTIHGHDYVGGLIGHAENYPFLIMTQCNSVVDLTGNNCAGGILGGNTALKPKIKEVTGEDGRTLFTDKISDLTFMNAEFTNNLAVGKISCTGDSIGGISGKYDFNYAIDSSYELEVRPDKKETFFNYYIGTVKIESCAFSGEIKGKDYVGGIAGYHHGGTIVSCYSNAVVTGSGDCIGGIVGALAGYYSDAYKRIDNANIKSCVTTNPIICSTLKLGWGNSLGRILGTGLDVNIGTPGTADENSAIASTRVFIGNDLQFVKDGLKNGTSVEQESLKKIGYYENKRWWFALGTFWVINENETFPYKWKQAVPPCITSDLVPQATTISGKSADGGKVYLQIDSAYVDSTLCKDNEWSFNVPALKAGEVVMLYVEAEGKLRSYTFSDVKCLGSGTETDPYRIYTAEDLQCIYNKGYYKQMNDIDLTAWISNNNPADGWKPIKGGYAINYDGDGHKVTGLWMESKSMYSGLFSKIASSSLYNLTIETATDKSVSGKSYVGALVGRMQNSTMKDITVKGNIKGITVGGIAGGTKNCDVKGVAFEGSLTSNCGANDWSYTGGLAAISVSDTIVSCKATVNINVSASKAKAGALLGSSSSTVMECMSGGSVNVDAPKIAFVGGLVGRNEIDYTNDSKNTGYINNCYSTARVSANSNSTTDIIDVMCDCSGGLVGLNYGTVTNSYATGNVKHTLRAGGLVGYNISDASVLSRCIAINKRVETDNSSGCSNRIIGDYYDEACKPGKDNYGINNMLLIVNGVEKETRNAILDGIDVNQNELLNKDFYTELGWDFNKVWCFTPENIYPELATFATAGYERGDVNRDRAINVVDVVDIARFVVGTPSTNFIYPLADINEDENVNIADAVSLVNVIAGDIDYMASAKVMRQAAANDCLSLTSDGNCLSLNLSGSTKFTACQFELNVPAEMSAATLSSLRGNGHTLLYNKVADGRYRIVVLSTSNDVFGSGNDALLTMTMSGDASAAKLTDIHFVTPDGIDHIFGTVGATTVTGIDAIGDDAHDDGCWYNMQGMKVAAPQHGVYIHNGKKVILK